MINCFYNDFLYHHLFNKKKFQITPSKKVLIRGLINEKVRCNIVLLTFNYHWMQR